MKAEKIMIRGFNIICTDFFTTFISVLLEALQESVNYFIILDQNENLLYLHIEKI